VAKLPVASGKPLAREGCHSWPSSAAHRNPVRLAIFGIQQTEINSQSLRLVQSDPLRKEFARFFNFAVVRQHSGGRTTRECGRFWRFLIDLGRSHHLRWPTTLARWENRVFLGKNRSGSQTWHLAIWPSAQPPGAAIRGVLSPLRTVSQRSSRMAVC